MERDLTEQQYGFRARRSTIYLIFAARQLQERRYEYRKDVIKDGEKRRTL